MRIISIAGCKLDCEAERKQNKQDLTRLYSVFCMRHTLLCMPNTINYILFYYNSAEQTICVVYRINRI